jgi:hypothetical protein
MRNHIQAPQASCCSSSGLRQSDIAQVFQALRRAVAQIIVSPGRKHRHFRNYHLGPVPIRRIDHALREHRLHGEPRASHEGRLTCSSMQRLFSLLANEISQLARRHVVQVSELARRTALTSLHPLAAQHALLFDRGNQRSIVSGYGMTARPLAHEHRPRLYEVALHKTLKAVC